MKKIISLICIFFILNLMFFKKLINYGFGIPLMIFIFEVYCILASITFKKHKKTFLLITILLIIAEIILIYMYTAH